MLQFHVPKIHRALVLEALAQFRPAALEGVIRALTSIQMPLAGGKRTLVAVGQRETFLARRYARQIARVIPGATGAMIPNAGHLWNLELPGLFSATAEAWITGRELPESLVVF